MSHRRVAKGGGIAKSGGGLGAHIRKLQQQYQNNHSNSTNGSDDKSKPTDNPIDIANQKKVQYFRWFMYVWMIKLGISCIGYAIPGGIMFVLRAFQVVPVVPTTIGIYNWNDNDNVDRKKSYLFQLSKIIDDNFPVLVRNVPVASPVDCHSIIKKYFLSLHKDTIHAKIHTIDGDDSSSVFTHHDSKRLWATMYSMKPPHDYMLYSEIIKEDISSSEYCDTDVNYHWYLTEAVVNPFDNSVIQALSTSIMDIIASKAVLSRPSYGSPRVNLWLSNRANITTSMHYDSEENFFLQLSGSKKFIISSPSHTHLYQPHSTLHPQWRQAQFPNRRIDSATDSINGVDGVSWEVELFQGDMLYIPPYYYHQVTTTSINSLSMNMWLLSSISDVYHKLQTIAPLPFNTQDSLNIKVASVASFTRLVLINLSDEIPTYQAIMRSRYEHLDRAEYQCHPWGGLGDTATEGVCSTVHILFADSNKEHKRAAITVASILQDNLKNAIDVQRLLLMDYTEEILSTILATATDSSDDGTDSANVTGISPCHLLNYINTCFDRRQQ